MSNETQETKPRKSELLVEHKQLLDRNDVLLKEMQEREYVIEFRDKSIYTSLLKFLEKESPWGHTTAAGLIMLYNNMKQQKHFTNEPTWDGKIRLRSANVSILWTMVTQMKGNGFHEAKRFVELMATIGETLSKAVQQVHFDNQGLRENHARINEIENLFINPESMINDVEEEIHDYYSHVNEVDPIVENV